MGFLAVDPYDGNHLLMSGHEMTALFQSFNGGQTWTAMPLGGMGGPGTAGVFFIDTGSAATTRNTWLWEFQQDTSASSGTWRTSNGGLSWTKVNTITKPHGGAMIYQPDTSGVLYEAGFYGPNGPQGEWQGIWRSTDYGQTWSGAQHVAGNNGPESIVWGTPNGVYASFDWACQFCDVNPNLVSAPQPGITGWTPMVRPAAM